jgi:hypothetical protein
MDTKRKIEQEYLLKTSVKVFENLIFTPNGLSEWFAEEVSVKEDIYNFHWDGSDEKARLISYKPGQHIKWIWLEDEENELDTYFEISYKVDEMTKTLVLNIVDYATEEDYEEVEMLWEASVQELKRVLGA